MKWRKSIHVLTFQLNIQAYDSAYPDARAEAQIFINVSRNVNGPQFQPSATYEKVIVDSFGVGEEVLTVRATDGDSTVRIIFTKYGIVTHKSNAR